MNQLSLLLLCRFLAANKHLYVSDRTDKKSKCPTIGTRKTMYLPNPKTLKATRNKFMLERERDSTWVLRDTCGAEARQSFEN